MRTKTYQLTGQNAAAASVAAAQLPTAGTPLTLAASPVVFGSQKTLTGFLSGVAQGTPSELTITTLSGSPAGQVFTVIGRDRWGINLITETITNSAGGAATLQSKCVYSTIVSITPSITDGTNNVSAGVPQRVTTPWVPFNNTRGFDQTNIGYVSVDNATGSPAYTLELSSVDANAQGVGQYPTLVGSGLGSGSANQPTYYGDNFPIDGSSNPTFTTQPAQIPQGAQWARLVNTSGAGTSSIARFVRPGY
jgi:hypothetical protein